MTARREMPDKGRIGRCVFGKAAVDGMSSGHFRAQESFVSQTLQARLEGLPKTIRAIAWKAQIRLCAVTVAGRIPVAPGTLDQYPAGTFVAGLCETGTPNPLASRPLGWHQAEKCHQLARIVEPPQIADFRDKRHGHSKGDAAHRLIGFDHRCHRPARHDFRHLLVEPAQIQLRLLSMLARAVSQY
jgi:hypothetical protein